MRLPTQTVLLNSDELAVPSSSDELVVNAVKHTRLESGTLILQCPDTLDAAAVTYVLPSPKPLGSLAAAYTSTSVGSSTPLAVAVPCSTMLLPVRTAELMTGRAGAALLLR